MDPQGPPDPNSDHPGVMFYEFKNEGIGEHGDAGFVMVLPPSSADASVEPQLVNAIKPATAGQSSEASNAAEFPLLSGWDTWDGDSNFHVSGDSSLTAEGQIQVNLHVWSMNQVQGFTGGALTNVYDATGTVIRKFLVTAGVDLLHSGNNDRHVQGTLPDLGGDPGLLAMGPVRIDHELGNFPQSRVNEIVSLGGILKTV
jgi:hypothetical protein